MDEEKKQELNKGDRGAEARATTLAMEFLDDCDNVANEMNVEPRWFLETVLKELHKLKEL